MSYTWDLLQASWAILKRDSRLLLFPLLSGICCLLVLASFAVPIVLTHAWRPPAGSSAAAQQVVYYGTLFGYYFINYMVITFFNVAIVACAVDRMRGGSPDLRFGFREAMARMHLIVGWALLSATVGLVLRIIEDRSKWLGRLVAGLLGVSWSVASYLVIPVLVVERKGALDALRDSAALFRKTWGERLAVNFGFGAILVLFALPGLLLVGTGIYVGAMAHNWPLGVACIVMGATFFLIVHLVQSALTSIFQAALYLHASGSTSEISSMPHGFPVELLQKAMVAK
jgi:hypothetical protein